MDKISLAHNIESRAPLLDDSLAPQSISSVKLNSKPLLRALHHDIYGATNLPKKGFSHPVDTLTLSSRYSEHVDEGINIVKSVFGSESAFGLRSGGSRRLYNLASLSVWCENN